MSGGGRGGGQRSARNISSAHKGHEWRAPPPPSSDHHRQPPPSSLSHRSTAPPPRPGSRVAQLLNHMDISGRKQQMLRGLEVLNDQPPHYGELGGFAAPGAPPSLIDGCIPETELGGREGTRALVRDLEATGHFPGGRSPSPTPTRRVNASHGVSASACASPLKSTSLGTPRSASPKRAPSPGAAVGSKNAHGRSPLRSATKPLDERPAWIPGGSPGRAPPAIPALLSSAAAGTPSPRSRSPSPLRARSPSPTPRSSCASHATPCPSPNPNTLRVA